jgi:thioredoxin-like negative regulator of GroEL
VLAALLCVASAADVVEAVHLFAEGSHFHEQHKGRGESTGPAWNTVIEATSVEMFMTTLMKEPLALVYFYTPWSEACRRFYGALDTNVAVPLKAMRPSIPVVAANMEDHPDLGKEFRIQTFPSFVAFRHGVVAPAAENQFPRHANGVLEHMQDLLKPAVAEVGSPADLFSLINSTWPHAPTASPRRPSRHPDDRVERTIVVGYLTNPAAQQEFVSTARFVGRHFRMALAADAAVASAGSAEIGTVVVYRHWGDGTPLSISFDETTKLQDLARYLVYNAVAPVGEFNEDTRVIYAQRHKPMLVYFSPSRLSQHDPLFATLSDVMMDDAMNVTAVQMNPNTAGRTVARFLGFDSEALGTQSWGIGLLIARKKYRFDSTSVTPTPEALREFIRAAKAETIREYHRSEGRSAIRPPGEVSDFTQQDFATDVIGDTRRDTLILVYQPNTRACRDLIAVFEDVARKLKAVSGVLVGQFNALDNDYHEAYATPGNPSVLYARRDRKLAPIRFNGVGRNADDILEFVAQNAAVSLSALAPSNQTPSATRRALDTPQTEDL